MRKRLIPLCILAVGWASPAMACSCPKELLIKEYGTIGVFGHAKTTAGPVRPVAVQNAATAKTPAQPLPLLVPIRLAPAVGADSLEWLLLDP
jgi:hypothetical protein